MIAAMAARGAVAVGTSLAAADVTPWQKYVDDFQQARWIRHLMMQRLQGVIDACLPRAQILAARRSVCVLRPAPVSSRWE
jgi:hypothetical protein